MLILLPGYVGKYNGENEENPRDPKPLTDQRIIHISMLIQGVE